MMEALNPALQGREAGKSASYLFLINILPEVLANQYNRKKQLRDMKIVRQIQFLLFIYEIFY